MPEFGEFRGKNDQYESHVDVGPHSISLLWHENDDRFEVYVVGQESVFLGNDPDEAMKIFEYAKQLALTESDPLKIAEKMKEKMGQ